MSPRFGLLCLFAGTALLWAAASRPHVARASEMPARSESIFVAPTVADEDLDHAIETLDANLAEKKPSIAWTDDAMTSLSNFVRHVQRGQLSADQEHRILQHFDDVSRTYPTHPALVTSARHVIETLTIGKTAPEIIGRDLDGNPLKLSDARGRVVVLLFSGEWCAICRTEYPYERLMLELYQNWPLTILGVNSDSSPAIAKTAYAERSLTFRSWYDGDPNGDPKGPIATQWNVSNWPTTYLIDAQGVIRSVNLLQEDLLKGVRLLLAEQQVATAASATSNRKKESRSSGPTLR